MFGIAKFKHIHGSSSKQTNPFDDISRYWVGADCSLESNLRIDRLIDWLALDGMCSRLGEHEEVWRDRQPILRSHGYILRPRLRPGWMPSWRFAGEHVNPFQFEDSKALPKSRSDTLLRTIDARRVSDGKLVHIKRAQANGIEHKIAEMLLHESSDNVMPVIDIFQSRQKPKEAFIVTPFLRAANSPAFDSVDNMLDCGEQLLENLANLHSKGIAHRSIGARDLAIDAAPLYPQGFHPIEDDCLPDGVTPARPLPRKHTRVNYYIVDFRSAVRFPAPYDPERPPMLDVDRDVLRNLAHGMMPPELRDTRKGIRVQYDPYMLDVWLLGRALDHMFNQTGRNVDFLRPLFDRMCHPAPGSRWIAVEALRQWRDMRAERMGSPRHHWRPKDRAGWLKETGVRDHARSRVLQIFSMHKQLSPGREENSSEECGQNSQRRRTP